MIHLISLNNLILAIFDLDSWVENLNEDSVVFTASVHRLFADRTAFFVGQRYCETVTAEDVATFRRNRIFRSFQTNWTLDTITWFWIFVLLFNCIRYRLFTTRSAGWSSASNWSWRATARWWCEVLEKLANVLIVNAIVVGNSGVNFLMLVWWFIACWKIFHIDDKVLIASVVRRWFKPHEDAIECWVGNRRHRQQDHWRFYKRKYIHCAKEFEPNKMWETKVNKMQSSLKFHSRKWVMMTAILLRHHKNPSNSFHRSFVVHRMKVSRFPEDSSETIG